MNTMKPEKTFTWWLAAAVALYAVLYRMVPYEAQAFLLWPFGALALYGGARLRWWQGLLLMLGVQAGVDMAFYLINGWEMPSSTYAAFAAFVLIGIAIRPLLSRTWTRQVAVATAASLVGYALFFAITNTAAWLENSQPYYSPHTLATWLRAMREGLEFIRYQPAQVFGNPVAVAMVFAVHAFFAPSPVPAKRFEAEPTR